MQPSLRISHSRSPLGFSYSVKRISVQDSPDRSPGFSYTPTLLPISSRRSFHSMHATWQALQPMHLVVSISLATVPVYASRTPGGAVVVAERRTMSRDCRAISARLHPSHSFSTLTRNDLNSGVCELPSPTTGVSVLARKPGLARPVKPQRSEEHTSELQSLAYLVCRLLLEKKKTKHAYHECVIYSDGTEFISH